MKFSVTRLLDRIAYWLAIVIVAQSVLLLRDFYLNQYEQAWFQFNYPTVYAVLMDPLPFLELAGALIALIVGAVWFNPWTLFHSRRLATTDNAAAQNTHFPAPRTDGEGTETTVSSNPSHAAVVPVVPPAGTTALTLSEKIQKRMSGQPLPPTLPNGKIAVSPVQLETNNGKDSGRSKVEALLSTRRKEFAEEEPEVKLRFNPRKFTYEPAED